MTRWWRGLRAASRIAARDARRARGRTTLVALMIGLPVLVAVAGGTLLQSTALTPERVVEQQLGPHAQALVEGFTQEGIRQDPTGTSWTASGPPPAQVPDLAAYEGDVAAVLPAGDRLVRLGDGRARLMTDDRAASGWASVVELPQADLPLVVPVLAEGAVPAAGEVLVGQGWADALDVGPGDTVTVDAEVPTATGGTEVRTRDVVVAGVVGPSLSTRDVYAPTGTVLGGPASARDVAWLVLGDAPVTWQHVVALNDLGSVVRSRDVVLDPPSAAELAAVGVGTERSDRVDPGTLALGGAVAAIVVVEAVLLIGPAFAVGARRSTRQLAVLAAAGAERRHLRQVVLLGGVVVGLGASLVAVVLGLGVAAVVRWVALALGAFAFPDLRVPWPLLPAAVVFGTAVATAAAWFPAWRAARTDVVAALAGRRAEAAPRRRVPVVGLVASAVGLALATWGSTGHRTGAVVGGIVAIELGLVLAAGALVGVVARLAPRLGVAGRFALRDAARQRGRTAPAVAAIVAAMAGVVTAAVYVESGERHRAAQYAPLAAEGTVLASLTPGDGQAARGAGVEQALRDTLPVDDVVPVRIGVAAEALAATDPGAVPSALPYVTAVRPPGNECPADAGTGAGSSAGRDPRCAGTLGAQLVWHDMRGSVLVDDGTVMAALGHPGAAEDAAALRSGDVLVGDPYAVRPDGTVRLEVQRWDDGDSAPRTLRTVTAPARVTHAADGIQFAVVLPPAVAAALDHVEVPAGFVATTTREPTPAEESRAYAAALRADTGAYVTVERGYTGAQPLTVWVLAAAALVVGLGATGISVALAGAEARPDLATLAAVGAAPVVRRRVAAAQAGVLSVVGALVGAVTGLALGRVLVVSERARAAYDPTWVVTVPWGAVAVVVLGVPLLSVAGAWLLTRSRLPMVRRVAA